MQIDYTALRSLKSGHTAGTDYTINIGVTVSDRMSPIVGKRHIARAGDGSTVIHREDKKYSVTTQLVNASSTPDLDDLREFVDSVKAGEEFQLDIDGTTQTYIIDNIANPYREIRQHPDWFRFSFTVRQR